MSVRVFRLVFALLALTACRAAAPQQPVDDFGGVRITLQRSACYGECPDYTVTIDGTGRVRFATDTAPAEPVDKLFRQYARPRGVLVPGEHEDRIALDRVAALLRRFQAAGFFSLEGEYRAAVTDNPTYVLTVETSAGRKRVTDYVGRQAGMPAVVAELERAVDETSGAGRWVRGDDGLVAWLERQGFDFRGKIAAELAVAATEGEGDEATPVALIDRGAPIGSPARRGGGATGSPGERMIKAAILRGRAVVFVRLVALGWLDRLGRSHAGELLAERAAGCSPALVDAAAAVGLPIDQPAPSRPGDVTAGGQHKTALAEAAGGFLCSDERRLPTVNRLLAHGADPNLRDSLGQTAIFGVEDLAVLNSLLAHGADASAVDRHGRSAVFETWTEAIVVRLLQAGASPVGRYDDDGRKTLAEQAIARKLTGVSAWLAAHPAALR